MKLKTFWFVTFPENRYGPRNIGVTAFTKEQARSIIERNALMNSYIEATGAMLDNDTEIIEDIDIRLLDQSHIIPNMGVVTFQGIWYPNLNSSG